MPGNARENPGPKVRVLIVDDSAIIRSLLRTALSQHPEIEVVGQAVDGRDALSKLTALRPDVATLDIEMPQLSGMEVLARASQLPTRFVMISSLTQAGAHITLEALRRGAFDYVTKPQAGGTVELAEFRAALPAKVIAAARARTRRSGAAASASKAGLSIAPAAARSWVVAIGISCGGPQTLMEMLPAFPSNFAPIVVTQHMPAAFTPAFAQHLDQNCAMRVKEAAEGDLLETGRILIAPGDQHLHVRRRGAQLAVKLDGGPKVSGHRPSVDAMFESLARVCGGHCVGVVMTGMGADGAAGIVQLKQAGCPTLAQDEMTSLVYGMPKAAYATGCVDQVVALGAIPSAICRLLTRAEGARPRAVPHGT